MNKTQIQEGYSGIYLERAGKDGRYLVESLITEPELPLNEFQKQEAYEFEKMIAFHELENGMTVDGAIRAHKGETTTAPYFFADAFLNGKINMPEMPDEPAPVFYSSSDVYSWLATVARYSKVSESVLAKMAKESANHYKRVVAELLLSGDVPPPSALDHMPIALNPTEMINNSQAIVQVRQFLHDLHGQYHEGGDKLDGAKRVLTDIYLAKVNSMVVGDMITLEYLIEQSKLIGDSNMIAAADVIIPEIVKRSLDNDKFRTIKRFDYLRNGMGISASGTSTVVDESVIEDIKSEGVESKLETPLFTPEQRDKLKAFKLSPDEMVGLYSRIIQKAGLLSSEDSNTWNPKRSYRASDGLFQVVINPGANNFAINGRSGVYKVASEARSLHDVIVVGGFHELEHINQVQIDFELGKKLNIAGIKGKRVGMFRESGANAKQRDAERALFGESKPIALAYARALQTLENGDDVFAATRAFYNEKRAVTPNVAASDVAKEAADRVLRLTLHGGINSEAMSYAEEKILNRELQGASVEVKARASAVTSLDLVDQVRLHKYDLLSMPEKPTIDWTSIILKEVEPYIMKALS
jgi:hypothetical protein